MPTGTKAGWGSASPWQRGPGRQDPGHQPGYGVPKTGALGLGVMPFWAGWLADNWPLALVRYSNTAIKRVAFKLDRFEYPVSGGLDFDFLAAEAFAIQRIGGMRLTIARARAESAHSRTRQYQNHRAVERPWWQPNRHPGLDQCIWLAYWRLH